MFLANLTVPMRHTVWLCRLLVNTFRRTRDAGWRALTGKHEAGLCPSATSQRVRVSSPALPGSALGRARLFQPTADHDQVAGSAGQLPRVRPTVPTHPHAEVPAV